MCNRRGIFPELEKRKVSIARVFFDGGHDSGLVTAVVFYDGPNHTKRNSWTLGETTHTDKALWEYFKGETWAVLGGYVGDPYKTGFIDWDVPAAEIYLYCNSVWSPDSVVAPASGVRVDGMNITHRFY